MTAAPRAGRSALAEHWTLDPSIAFLNHGSFGATPKAVLARQAELRARMEQEPVRFLVRELEPLWDASREALAAFVGAEAGDLVFVANATAGINAVLRSLSFEPGDELIVTNHEYNASRNALEFVAAKAGAKVVVAAIPFPIASEEQAVDAVLAKVRPTTRLVLIDHVTSQTGLVLPVQRLARELKRRGVELLVDGAHAPGMVELELRTLGATYYTGNCHKWICGPKSAAFLWVERARQAEIRPLAISHGANSTRTDRSRFQLEFDWTGTQDPTAALCVGEALRVIGGLVPGGWAEVRRLNREKALLGRKILCEALEVPEPAPASMIGSLASVPLPDGDGIASKSPLYTDPLQDALFERHQIEVPVVPWPALPKRLVRISAQLYNSEAEYRALAAALRTELSRR